MFVVKVWSEKWGSKKKGIFIDQQWSKGNLMEISPSYNMLIHVSAEFVQEQIIQFEKKHIHFNKRKISWKETTFVDYYVWKKGFNCFKIKKCFILIASRSVHDVSCLSGYSFLIWIKYSITFSDFQTVKWERCKHYGFSCRTIAFWSCL